MGCGASSHCGAAASHTLRGRLYRPEPEAEQDAEVWAEKKRPASAPKRPPAVDTTTVEVVESATEPVSPPAALSALGKANELYEKEDWAAAAGWYGTAVRAGHLSPATLLNQQAVCLAELPQRLHDAVAHFSRAVEQHPTTGQSRSLATVLHNRGAALLTLGDLHGAETDLQRAFNLSHDPATAKLLLEVKEATLDLDAPKPARDKVNAALTLYADGDWAASRALFQDAIELDYTRKSRCWNGIGLCHFSEESFEEALEAFKQAVAEDPGNGRAWHNKAKTLDALGLSKMADTAREQAKEAMKSPWRAIVWCGGRTRPPLYSNTKTGAMALCRPPEGVHGSTIERDAEVFEQGYAEAERAQLLKVEESLKALQRTISNTQSPIGGYRGARPASVHASRDRSEAAHIARMVKARQTPI